MFLLCVTRGAVTGGIVATSVREFAIGDWLVTVATDEWLSSVVREGDRIVVREAAPFPASRGGGAGESPIVFATAVYSQLDQAIDIEKSLVGGRQVYYHVAPDGSFYCSSHARLLRAAGVRLEEDPARMSELFVYRYVSAPRTLFKGVHQLLAGQRLRFERAGPTWPRCRSELYHPPAARLGAGGAPGEYATRTREALAGAMQALEPTRNRVHVLASGGLDSSILFKLAQNQLGTQLGYSTSYPFQAAAGDVEKEYAVTAARAMRAGHHFHLPTSQQFLRGFFDAVSIAEEPIVHTQSVLMMLLLRDGLPRGEGTVVVGQGADGAFGLRLHQTVEKVDRFRRNHPRVARFFHPSLWGAAYPMLSFAPLSRVVRRGVSLLGQDHGFMDVFHKRWGGGVPLSDPRHILWALGATGFNRWARRRFGATREQVYASRLAAIGPYADRSVLDAISLLDFLSDVSTTQGIWSKFGEAARKVVYYPFNAKPLLDAAFETPWEAKLAEPKAVLRDVARQLGIPEFIITRRKANFNIEPDQWAIRGAVLEPLVPLASNVFGEAEVRRMQVPNSRGAFTFWTMLNYAVWKRLVVDGESVDALLADVGEPLTDAEAPEQARLAVAH